MPKKSWLLRVFFEYLWFYFFSKKIKIKTWLSLHDITPNVIAMDRVVYCHNPSPFYKSNIIDLILDSKFFLFTIFYKYLYKINLRKNNLIIVQQEWIKSEFIKYFGKLNIISCRPISLVDSSKENTYKKTDSFNFIYPTLPRTYKNIELINKATRKNYSIKFKIFITISGHENLYAKFIYYLTKGNSYIELIGRKSKDEMNFIYKNSNCLIFTSKLETWGLPLTEAINYNLPIICLDMPYARETTKNYSNIRFIKNNHEELQTAINDLLKNRNFKNDISQSLHTYDCNSWIELIDKIKLLNSSPSL